MTHDDSRLVRRADASPPGVAAPGAAYAAAATAKAPEAVVEAVAAARRTDFATSAGKSRS